MILLNGAESWLPLSSITICIAASSMGLVILLHVSPSHGTLSVITGMSLDHGSLGLFWGISFPLPMYNCHRLRYLVLVMLKISLLRLGKLLWLLVIFYTNFLLNTWCGIEGGWKWNNTIMWNCTYHKSIKSFSTLGVCPQTTPLSSFLCQSHYNKMWLMQNNKRKIKLITKLNISRIGRWDYFINALMP